MRAPEPVTLEGHGVRLEPLAREHHDALVEAARDGELWNLWFTSVPAPAGTGRSAGLTRSGEARVRGPPVGRITRWPTP